MWTQSIRAVDMGGSVLLWLHQGGHQEPWLIADGLSLKMQCGLEAMEAHGKDGHIRLAPGAQDKLKLHWAASKW